MRGSLSVLGNVPYSSKMCRIPRQLQWVDKYGGYWLAGPQRDVFLSVVPLACFLWFFLVLFWEVAVFERLFYPDCFLLFVWTLRYVCLSVFLLTGCLI